MNVLNRMDKSIDGKARISRPSSSLHPPPLFRRIGPPGLSASLPPHRRLRSLFCRSRAVLPANTHHTEASETHNFTDIQTGNHAHTSICPLGCNDVLSEDIQSNTVLKTLQPEVDSDLHRRAMFRSVVFTDTWSISASPQEKSGQQDRWLFSHLCPSAGANDRNRGRQGRLVTPLQTSEDPAMKEKQQQKRGKRSYKVDCAGTQKYVVPSLTEKEGDARLCEWLQSLGIADSNLKDSVTTNNQQRLFVSRCRGGTGHRETDDPISCLPSVCRTPSYTCPSCCLKTPPRPHPTPTQTPPSIPYLCRCCSRSHPGGSERLLTSQRREATNFFRFRASG